MNEPSNELTLEQRELLRAYLERAMVKLKRSMKTTNRSARPVKLDQSSVGRLSRIDAIQNQGLSQGLQERERSKAAQIDEALRRLDAGTYGTCEGCGGPIQFERLTVFPETSMCSTCAT